MGAVIMNTISSTSITSTSGVTLMSASGRCSPTAPDPDELDIAIRRPALL